MDLNRQRKTTKTRTKRRDVFVYVLTEFNESAMIQVINTEDFTHGIK